METEKKIPRTPRKSNWVECESKKKPGQKYLFNTETGESKWMTRTEVTPPIQRISKVLSTPANDRLKRLQKDLKNDHVFNKTSKKQVEKKSISSKNCLKRPNEKTDKSSNNNFIETISTEPTENLSQANNSGVSQTNVKNKLSKRRKLAYTVEKIKLKDSTNTDNKSETLKKPSLVDFKLRKIEKTHNVITKNFNKDQKEKTITNVQKKATVFIKKEQTLKDIEKSIGSNLEMPEIKFLSHMPKCFSTPTSYSKGTANKRLLHYRQSLQNENLTRNTEKCLKEVETRNKSININSDCEEMDWEPSIEQKSNWSSTALTNSVLDETTDMEVDENLMLNAAEKEMNSCHFANKKWRKDNIYVILDTNVFIHHLEFIENIKVKKIADAGRVILYLPYIVLQELDHLKLRENIKIKVVRAVKYLNKMFENKDDSIQAQSAFENRRHLIDIESSDDCVLNCCLQVLEHIPKTNTILLTEDVNLRNKAMCNDIAVSTKANLLKKIPTIEPL